MKTFIKTILRSFKSNIARMIAITAIILLGVGFVSGLGTTSKHVLASYNEQLILDNASDIIIKSKETTGFSKSEIEKVKEYSFVKEAQGMTIMDSVMNKKNSRVYLLPKDGLTINNVQLIEGRMPETRNEIVVERASMAVESYEINDEVTLFGTKLTIVGIGRNPLIFIKEGEPDLINQEDLTFICYASEDLFFAPLIPKTDINIVLRDREKYELGSKEYFEYVNKSIDELKKTFDEESCAYLTLDENKSYKSLTSYCEKVDVIALMFPIFFILVSALVVLTTMTRMVEEERSQIGCYATLGISKKKIVMKYVIIAVITCLIGGVIGVGCGLFILPHFIFKAFEALYFLPLESNYYNILPGFISALLIFLSVILVTIYVVRKDLNYQPAELLLPKSPKAGRKILLERINFIWKHLSFKYKSCLRNIFRYRNHLIMTIVSVSGSTVLVFAGFALLDVIVAMESGEYGMMSEAIKPIAIVIILFALLLCAFVIYNLTNMNIGERKRELATLKVLGYREEEVSTYIFREVFIMALMGIILGIPLGMLFMSFVLRYIGFGAFSDIKWYTYFITALCEIGFIFGVDMLLLFKIKVIDMTTSLKSVE